MQQRREVAEAVAGQGSVEIDPARILDLVVDAIYMRSFADGRIQYWNAGAEAMYGWSAAEAIGASATELLETEFRAEREEVRRKLVESGRWEGVLNQRARNGNVITVLSRWNVVEIGRGRQPLSVLVVNTDITNQVDVETRLGASEEMFQLMVEAVED